MNIKTEKEFECMVMDSDGRSWCVHAHISTETLKVIDIALYDHSMDEFKYEDSLADMKDSFGDEELKKIQHAGEAIVLQ